VINGWPLLVLKLRPCVRRKFLNVLFSRVSEMFGFRSSEIFRKKPEFSNSRNFREKVRKKFGNLSSEKSFIGQKVWKRSEKFGKVRKIFGNFGNWFFRMFGNFGNLEIPNFPKTSKKWHPIRTSEITKYSFRLGNRPKSSVKSLECRASVEMIYNQNVVTDLDRIATTYP